MFSQTRAVVRPQVMLLFAAEVVLIAAAFTFATYVVTEVDPFTYLIDDGGLIRLVPAISSVVAAVAFSGLYSEVHFESRISLIHRLGIAMGLVFLIEGSLSYFGLALPASRRVVMVGSVFSISAILLSRLLFNLITFSDTVLLVGDSPLLADIAKDLQEQPKKGAIVVGHVSDKQRLLASGSNVALLGPTSQLRVIVQKVRPTRIIVGMLDRRGAVPLADLLSLRFGGHIIEEASSFMEHACGRIVLRELRPSQLIFSPDIESGGRTLALGTILSSVISAIGLIFASPLMLATALAIRLSTSEPILRREKMVGLDGVPFTLYRFNCASGASTSSGSSSTPDVSFGRLGKLMPRLGVDSLPELLNCLKGDMALVGPRPVNRDLAASLATDMTYYCLRHSVRPGMTGWAQVASRLENTVPNEHLDLEYDLYYVKHRSLILDVYILAMTLQRFLVSFGRR